MSALTIPLIAIYNFDGSILDGLHVPTAADLPGDVEYIDPIPALSDDDLKMRLLFQIGELSPVYTDPELLKSMIAIWSTVNKPNWVRLWETTLYKYNPIWNKDGSYTDTRQFSLSGQTSQIVAYDEAKTHSETGKDTTSGNTASTETGSTSEQSSGTENTTHSVTGFDTNALSVAAGDNTSTSGNKSGSSSNDQTVTASGETNITRNASDSTDADTNTSGTQARTETETFTHTEQGNIGVTTTQQMIKEQREIVEFNIYNYIIESFKKDFMIALWDI